MIIWKDAYPTPTPVTLHNSGFGNIELRDGAGKQIAVSDDANELIDAVEGNRYGITWGQK